MGESIQWTKYNLWWTAFKKFEGIWSASFKFFKGCLSQILLDPLLNTLSQMILLDKNSRSMTKLICKDFALHFVLKF